MQILFDDSITPSTCALILSESEALPAGMPDLEFRFWDIAKARTAMLQVSTGDRNRSAYELEH